MQKKSLQRLLDKQNKKTNPLVYKTRGFFILEKKVIRVAKKKGSAEQIINRSPNLSTLAQKIAINSKRLAIEGGLSAIGVLNGGYQPVKLSINDNSDSVYRKLVALAKKEVNDYYGKVGVTNGISITLDSKQQDNPVKEVLRQYILKMNKNTGGGNLSTVALRGVDYRGKETEEAVDDLTRRLLGMAAGDSLNGEVSWLRESEALRACVRFLQGGQMRQAIAKVGDILEHLAFLEDKMVAETIQAKIKKLTQTGRARDYVRYKEVDKKGNLKDKVISLTGTIDGILQMELKDGADFSAAISVKLAADPFRIRYKSVSGKGSEALTGIIAEWSNIARLSGYISSAYSNAPGATEFNLMLAATVASLAVGGYDPNQRALLALTSSGYGDKENTGNKGAKKGDISIKSLDKVLRGIQKDSKMRMEEVKISIPKNIVNVFKKDKDEANLQSSYDSYLKNEMGLVLGYLENPEMYGNAYQQWNESRAINLAFYLKTSKNILSSG